ncbi:MAG TPA: phosphotransferase [Kofleriaceae bacterium]|nr:phosphotransferase [Kofleriaceae bacterium]
MELHACLPAELAGATITRIAAGLSGAGVYRVEAAGASYVLKVAADAEPIAAWRRRAEVYQLAAAAGLAPRVIHVDEAHRAITSAFVADRSLFALLGDPRTRAGAIDQLGATLRRVHDLPLPEGAEPRDLRALLGQVWSSVAAIATPSFVGEAVAGALAEVAPPSERALVLSHNDVNPSNLIHDGERVLLLDWDAAGPADPLFDLAALALFLRLDRPSCAALIAAHDGAPPAALPQRFGYFRRLIAVAVGVMFLHLARASGHAGASDDPGGTLADCHRRMRTRALDLATPDGRWAYGLALIRESSTPIP